MAIIPTFTYHWFADAAGFNAAKAGLSCGMQQAIFDGPYAISVNGTLIGPDPLTGINIYVQVPLAGLYVNAAWNGVTMPAAFQASQIAYPGSRKFAGAP